MRIHLVRPGPADAVVEREPVRHFPGILAKPFHNGLALIGAVTRVGLGVVIKNTEGRIGERPVCIQGVVSVLREAERAVEEAALAFVLADAVDIHARFDGVPPMRPGQAVVEVKGEVRTVLEETVVEGHIGRVRDAERKTRNDSVGIGGRIPLPGREADRGTEHR